MARARIVAGKPSFEGPIVGGFTEYTQVVGGILANAGVKGFLGNIDQMYEIADEEGPQWENFLSVLHEGFCGRTVKTREIREKFENDPSLMDTVPDEFEDQFDRFGGMKPQFASKLGRAFKRREGTRYGHSQLRVERAQDDTHERVARWRIVCGDCGICGDHSSQSPQKPENLQNINIQHLFEEPALVDPANPAIPAQTLSRCHACGDTNWRTHPNGNDEYCGTCHPNYLTKGGKQ